MIPLLTTNQTDKAIYLKTFHTSLEKKNDEAYFLSEARKIYDIITRKFSVYSPHVIPLRLRMVTTTKEARQRSQT